MFSQSKTIRDFEEEKEYSRQGYAVSENHSSGPDGDGGIDLILRKDGNVILVQCKQWRSAKVSVKIVREMFGLMTAERANGAIIITSGLFTQEAKNFTNDKPIDLVSFT